MTGGAVRRIAPGCALAAFLLAGCGAPAPRVYRIDEAPAVLRVAVMPLMNYTEDRDAPDRIMPVVALELARKPGVQVVDPGVVEEALAREPWILADRLPPDLVDALGESMGASALLVGAVLAHGYLESDGERIPQVSLTLRLLETPGGRVLWSANHTRSGDDSETLFGFGRVTGLEQLVDRTVEEILRSFPRGKGDPDLAQSRNP